MDSFEQLVKQYNDTKYKIRRLVLQQQELRELGCLPGASNLDGMPHAPGNGTSTVEKYLMRLDDLEKKQISLEQRLETIRDGITFYIDKIPSYVTREIFEYKIFMGKGWRYIARQVCYSVSRLQQFYADGLAEIRKISKQIENYTKEGDG